MITETFHTKGKTSFRNQRLLIIKNQDTHYICYIKLL